jgi:hypothetical protein
MPVLRTAWVAGKSAIRQTAHFLSRRIGSPLNRGGGQTTGTINPGLLWAGQFLQLSVEAMIPLNAQSGHNVGVIGQLHFYLDDLFPAFFGKPLFGGK